MVNFSLNEVLHTALHNLEACEHCAWCSTKYSDIIYVLIF